jgi:hypothetical protein
MKSNSIIEKQAVHGYVSRDCLHRYGTLRALHTRTLALAPRPDHLKV